jgi:outer membrane protein assembly factor BamB
MKYWFGIGWCCVVAAVGPGSLRGQGPGPVLWEFNAPAALESPAVAEDGSIYVISGTFWVHALSGAGVERWTTNFASLFFVPPTLMGDGTILLTERDRYLIAVNPEGGEKWRFAAYVRPSFSAPLQNFTAPALAADGTIYFCAQLDLDGQPDFRFFALNSDGVEQWSYQDSGAGYSSPAVAEDGSIYLVRGTRLFCFLPNGFKAWELPLGSAGSLTDSAGEIALGSNGVIYVAADQLYAAHPDGTLLWAFDPGAGTVRAPILAPDGTIYLHGGVPDVNSAFIYYQSFGLNPGGTLRYLSPPRSSPEAPAVVGVDGTIFSTPGRNGVCALWPTLASKWCVRWSKAPVLTPGGILYAVSTNNLTAYRSACGLARSVWPMPGRDPRHTGRVAGWPPVNPCLTALQWNPFRGFQFTVTAEVGWSGVLQASANLTEWENVAFFTATEPVTHVSDPSVGPPMRFYRLAQP